MTLRAHTASLLTTPRRGADRRAHRARQPPRARDGSRRALRRAGRRRATLMLVALRPRRLQALQRRLRPPGRRRAARAPRPRVWRDVGRAAAAPTGMGGDEFCALLGPAPTSARPRRGALPRALSEQRRRLRDRLLARRDRCSRRRRPDTDRRHAPRRPADVRAQAATAAFGERQSHRRAAARHGRAVPRSRRPLRRRRRPRRGDGRRARAGTARRSRRSAARRSCTTSARSPSRRRSSPSPGRWSRGVGLHPPPHGHRRADRRAPRPRSAASPSSSARATSATTAAGYPDGLAGEEIPLGARIVAVCDAFDAMTQHAVLPRGDRPRARARRAAALRRRRSSTRPSSPPSCGRGRTPGRASRARRSLPPSAS